MMRTSRTYTVHRGKWSAPYRLLVETVSPSATHAHSRSTTEVRYSSNPVQLVGFKPPIFTAKGLSCTISETTVAGQLCHTSCWLGRDLTPNNSDSCVQSINRGKLTNEKFFGGVHTPVYMLKKNSSHSFEHLPENEGSKEGGFHVFVARSLCGEWDCVPPRIYARSSFLQNIPVHMLSSLATHCFSLSYHFWSRLAHYLFVLCSWLPLSKCHKVVSIHQNEIVFCSKE